MQQIISKMSCIESLIKEVRKKCIWQKSIEEYQQMKDNVWEKLALNKLGKYVF